MVISNMAKIIHEDKEIEIKDGEKVTDACEKLGVPFGCYHGDCGACKIEILEGAKNLSEITDKEQNFGCDNNNRLACQCNIKSGEVKIKF